LSREGWIAEEFPTYVSLGSGWHRCRACVAKAVEYLRAAPNLRDPVCSFILATLSHDDAFMDFMKEAEARNMWMWTLQPPQSNAEARSLIHLSMESADRLAACEGVDVIEWAPWVAPLDILDGLLAGWARANDPYMRSRFGEVVFEAFQEEGSSAIHEQVADALIEKWDREEAEGTRVGMHRIASWLLNRDLPASQEQEIRDRLIREFQDGYGPRLSPAAQSAGDALCNSKGGLARLEAHLGWFEKALASQEPAADPGIAFNVFASLSLSKDDSDEAHRYADLVTQTLIRTFPAGDDERRVHWIWAMKNAGAPLGRSFLAATKSKDPRVASYLEWAVGSDGWKGD
jgi:hypothetical protein